MRKIFLGVTLAAATLFFGVAAKAQNSDTYAVDNAGYARVMDAATKQLGVEMKPIPDGQTFIESTAVKGSIVFAYRFDGTTLTVTLTCPTSGLPTPACQSANGMYATVHQRLTNVIKSAL